MEAAGGFERTLDLRGDGGDLRSFIEQVVGALPFTAFMDIQVGSVEPGRAEICLPGRNEYTNHLGTVHAIAELVPAETAGGVAISSGVGDLLQQGYVPIAKGLRVNWTAPARGPLTATAELPAENAETMRTAAANGERVACTLAIPVSDGEGVVVAEVEIDYVLKQLG
ncbi:MAG: DUF4442 domain-containing protein [Nitriliruptorales bacterium]|nr:DUF4442 domain-containing protein [Nitriliruptorales bacterium]